MQELVRYWGANYEFGRLEARLSEFPHLGGAAALLAGNPSSV
jgi:hypothetical protein